MGKDIRTTHKRYFSISIFVVTTVFAVATLIRTALSLTFYCRAIVLGG